jgi:hypothetical protein
MLRSVIAEAAGRPDVSADDWRLLTRRTTLANESLQEQTCRVNSKPLNKLL